MPNGFAFKTWSDVGAFVLLIVFLISGLTWGMKLEARYDAINNDVKALQRQVGNGILPRAEERLRSLAKDLEQHEESHR